MWSLIRFEALRFLRHPRAWLIMVLFVVGNSLPLHFSDRLEIGFVWFAVLLHALAGFVGAMMVAQARTPGGGTDVAYLLSRTGTRSRVLASRWAWFVIVAAALTAAQAVAFGARGKLSPHSRAAVRWESLPAIEAATGTPAETEPGDLGLYQLAQKKGRSTEFLRAHVELPGAAGTILALMFLALVIGFALQAAQGPATDWDWSRMRSPVFHATWVPLAAGILVLLPRTGAAAKERVFLAAHFHLGAVVLAAVGVIALYGWLGLRQWRTADL